MRISVLYSIVVLAIVWTALRLRIPQRASVQRLTPALLAAVALVAAAVTTSAVLRAPYFEWNDPRLAVTAAILKGFPMYAPVDHGPLLGHVYGPVSPVVYIPALLMPTPGLAVSAGSLIAFAVMVLPVLWLLASQGRCDWRLTGLACVTFWIFAAVSRILGFAGFSIHADAPALGFAALACSLLYTPERRTRPAVVAAAALAAILAVGSKQVVAPLLVVLPFWFWLVDDRAALRRFLAIGTGVAALAAAALFTFVDVRAMVFNVVELPSRYPLKPASGLSLILRATRDLAPRMVPFALTVAAVAALDRRTITASPSTARHWCRAHPWTLFVALSIATVPLAFLGRSIVGGSLNALSYPLYFLVIAGLLALVQLSQEPRALHGVPVRAAVLFTLAVMSGVIAVGHAPRLAALADDVRAFARNPEDEIFRVVRERPAEMYLPFMPLVSLMAEGNAYHFSYALYDRELGGVPVGQDRFRAHMPTRLTYVAAYRLPMSHYHSTAYLPEFTRAVEMPGLPDWTVVMRGAPGE